MKDSYKIYIINGPNLNMLGLREPEVYGSESLEDIKKFISSKLNDIKINSFELVWYQSNVEGELVTQIQKAIIEEADGIVINPGAYTHTSVAIYDALKSYSGRKCEIHLSNTFKREEFRKNRITSRAVDGCIEGFGKYSYLYGILNILNF